MKRYQLLFSCIYDADTCAGVYISAIKPPKSQAKLWELTEKGLSEIWGYSHPQVGDVGGQHRKYIALLTQEQFDEFVEYFGFSAEDVGTMGAVGAPGFGFGWSPAISFNSDNRDAYQNMYVTPVYVYRDRPEGMVEIQGRHWDMIRRAIINKY